MTTIQFLERNAAEIIGLVAILGMLMFTVDYFRHAKWWKNPQGRAVMFVIVAVGMAVTLLVIHGFVDYYPGRVWVEIATYTPLAFATFYLRHTLRQSLGLRTRWLLRVPKKGAEDTEVDEDTQPPIGGTTNG